VLNGCLVWLSIFIRDVPERKKINKFPAKTVGIFMKGSVFFSHLGQLFVFEKLVLECETFFLTLLPFFKIKINICTLREEQVKMAVQYWFYLTISYSSVMAFGSSCL